MSFDEIVLFSVWILLFFSVVISIIISPPRPTFSRGALYSHAMERPQLNMKYCPKCGATYGDDKIFCKDCGRELGRKNPIPHMEPIAVGILLLLVLTSASMLPGSVLPVLPWAPRFIPLWYAQIYILLPPTFWTVIHLCALVFLVFWLGRYFYRRKMGPRN